MTLCKFAARREKTSMRETKRGRRLKILVRFSFLELVSHGWMGNYINGNNTEQINREIISAPKDLMWRSLTRACWYTAKQMTKCCSNLMAMLYNMLCITIFLCKHLNSAALIVRCKIPTQECSLYIYIYLRSNSKLPGFQTFDNQECKVLTIRNLNSLTEMIFSESI